MSGGVGVLHFCLFQTVLVTPHPSLHPSILHFFCGPKAISFSSVSLFLAFLAFCLIWIVLLTLLVFLTDQCFALTLDFLHSASAFPFFCAVYLFTWALLQLFSFSSPSLFSSFACLFYLYWLLFSSTNHYVYLFFFFFHIWWFTPPLFCFCISLPTFILFSLFVFH